MIVSKLVYFANESSQMEMRIPRARYGWRSHLGSMVLAPCLLSTAYLMKVLVFTILNRKMLQPPVALFSLVS